MSIKRFAPALAIMCATGLLLSGCGPTASDGSSNTASNGTSGKTSITVFISGDTNVDDLWSKGIIPAFEKANSDIEVKTQLDLHGEHDQQTVAKLATAVKDSKDPGYQLIDAGWVTGQAQKADLLDKVSESDEPAFADIPKDTVEGGKGVGIPYRASSVLLAYDSQKVTSVPKTLKDLIEWIKNNPGQFAYNSPATGGSGGAFVTTVLDSHLTKDQQDKLRQGKDEAAEAAWKAGFDELASLNPYVYQKGVYPNGNDQVLQMLGNGSIQMAPVWSDQFITAQKNGTIPENVKYTQISDPSLNGSASYLGIPKTADNKDAVKKLVAFVLSPDGQKIISDQVSGYPVISLDKMGSDVAEKFKDADPSALRPSYDSEVTSDMNNQWDKLVPGK